MSESHTGGAPAVIGQSDPALPAAGAARRVVNSVYLVCGVVLVGLGIVGAFVPVMPTTVFLILAAWCFARSSPRLEGWLLRHPSFGPVLVAWRRDGAIPRRGKVMACVGMAAGLGLLWLGAQPATEVLLIVAAAIGASAWYILSRPEPGPALTSEK